MSETATIPTPTTLTPHLTCANAAEAVAFYPRAFGAVVLFDHRSPDGRVMHATFSINGATFMMHDDFPENGIRGPLALGGSPVVLHLQVADCDAVFAQAVAAGCTVTMPLEDQFWGDRYGAVVDPFGHHWAIATTVKKMTNEEMAEAAKEAMSQMCEKEREPVAA